jgi:hypothetical protein
VLVPERPYKLACLQCGAVVYAPPLGSTDVSSPGLARCSRRSSSTTNRSGGCPCDALDDSQPSVAEGRDEILYLLGEVGDEGVQAKRARWQSEHHLHRRVRVVSEVIPLLDFEPAGFDDLAASESAATANSSASS